MMKDLLKYVISILLFNSWLFNLDRKAYVSLLKGETVQAVIASSSTGRAKHPKHRSQGSLSTLTGSWLEFGQLVSVQRSYKSEAA